MKTFCWNCKLEVDTTLDYNSKKCEVTTEGDNEFGVDIYLFLSCAICHTPLLSYLAQFMLSDVNEQMDSHTACFATEGDDYDESEFRTGDLLIDVLKKHSDWAEVTYRASIVCAECTNGITFKSTENIPWTKFTRA